MLSHGIARRYAKGLLEAVAEIASGREANIKDDLASLVEAIDGHDGLKLLIMMNPAVSVQQKQAILGKIMETIGLDPTVKRFVDVLAEKQRLDHLSLISDVYGELVDEKSGVVNAEITTAAPLGSGQVAQLEKSLHESTGGEVRISRKTDPQLLGGVVTRIGDVVYDGSLQGQLARIRELLEST